MKKQKPEFSLAAIQANPATQKQLEGFVAEMVRALTEIKLKKEAIGDIRSEASDSLGIPPKVLMTLVKESLNEGTIEAEINELTTIQGIAELLNPTKP